jgi:hypothetical protein
MFKMFVVFVICLFQFINLGENTFKGAKKTSNVKNYHKKLEFFLLPFETMIVMAIYSSITHMNMIFLQRNFKRLV